MKNKTVLILKLKRRSDGGAAMHIPTLRNCYLYLALFMMLMIPISTNAKPSTSVPLATPEQVEQAYSVFKEWTELYQQEEYAKQHKLNHPRTGTPKRLWIKLHAKSTRKNGKLISYDTLAVSALHTSQLPCTEMGHCYRKDMQVVIIFVNSHYENIGDKNKEFIIMANHRDGWGWGGGTFLNRPFGESIVIMDRADVNKYKRNRIDRTLENRKW